jgi:YVTN family beta-propeller protein
VDARGARIFIALAAEDEVQVLDLATGTEVRRIALRTGDEPRELGLTSDGRVLVVVNRRSNSVTFVDAVSLIAQDRVLVGEEPWTLLVDRPGRWAYVLNRRSSSISVVDVARRVPVATIPTDPEPLRAQLSRDGSRLYVIHRGSAYMNVYSVPDFSLLNRVYVGLGAGALRVDSRTDLVYVGRADEGRIQLFDPTSLLPMSVIDVPGPVSYLAIDDLENTLLAVLPERRQVAFVDLTSKRLLSTLDVPRAPYQVAPIAERF